MTRSFSRRGFNVLVAGAASAALPQLARAAEPDFSVVVPNDPQYLAALCGRAYSAMMQWIVDNQATVIDGSPLNIKAVVSAGDCVNTSNSGEAGIASTAWSVLDSNGIPWVSAPGNHDMVGTSGDLSARILAANFQARGFFAPDVRSSKSYWGSALPGGGGYCYWGGSYDTSGANTYMLLAVGAIRQLYIFLEFHPRLVVLDWAQGIHDAHPGYEVIVVTHSYLSGVGEQVTRGTSGTASNAYGPDVYNQGAVPNSTSGTEMWAGSDTFGGFGTWTRLRMIVCGHWVWKPWHVDSNGQDTGWIWMRTPITSASERGQTVHQLFANVQDADNTYDYATGSTTGGPCMAGVESAHLFILKFCPSLEKLRFYGLSTHTGNWTGAKGMFTSATPVRLFDVDWPAEPGHFFPFPHRPPRKRDR
jgi:hypothetical protein